MSDLIIAGFGDDHTAFLVCAALARMQTEVALGGDAVAVVSRNTGGDATVRESIGLKDQRTRRETFWHTLVGQLFRGTTGNGPVRRDAAVAGLSAIGIGEKFRADVEQIVKPGTSAVAIVVTATTRDKVMGLLYGCGAKTIKSRLIGEDRKRWMASLSGCDSPVT